MLHFQGPFSDVNLLLPIHASTWEAVYEHGTSRVNAVHSDSTGLLIKFVLTLNVIFTILTWCKFETLKSCHRLVEHNFVGSIHSNFN